MTQVSPFHRGEQELQLRLGMRDKMERLGLRMIRDHMPDEHREFFSQLPLFPSRLQRIRRLTSS